MLKVGSAYMKVFAKGAGCRFAETGVGKFNHCGLLAFHSLNQSVTVLWNMSTSTHWLCGEAPYDLQMLPQRLNVTRSPCLLHGRFLIRCRPAVSALRRSWTWCCARHDLLEPLKPD